MLHMIDMIDYDRFSMCMFWQIAIRQELVIFDYDHSEQASLCDSRPAQVMSDNGSLWGE